MKHIGFLVSIFFVGMSMLYEYLYHDFPRACLMMGWAVWVYVTSRPANQ